MAKAKQASTSSPFKAMEDEAYTTFREWPIFLVMRQKELEAHLAGVPSLHTAADTSSAANTGRPAKQPQVNK